MVVLLGRLQGKTIVLDDDVPPSVAQGAKAEVHFEEKPSPPPPDPLAEPPMDPAVKEILLKVIGIRNERGELVLPPPKPERIEAVKEWRKAMAEYEEKYKDRMIPPETPRWTRDELYDRDD